MIDKILEYVDGGCCSSIEEIVTALGIDYDSLDHSDLEEIDEYLFTCSECDWTMPIDELDCDEDYLICRECNRQ